VINADIPTCGTNWYRHTECLKLKFRQVAAMAIKLRCSAANLYEAVVRPPHVAHEWSTSSPMLGRQLVKTLQAMGCHQQDIGDAFYEVEPEWVSKLEPRE
jgi:hypothetical protein